MNKKPLSLKTAKLASIGASLMLLVAGTLMMKQNNAFQGAGNCFNSMINFGNRSMANFQDAVDSFFLKPKTFGNTSTQQDNFQQLDALTDQPYIRKDFYQALFNNVKKAGDYYTAGIMDGQNVVDNQNGRVYLVKINDKKMTIKYIPLKHNFKPENILIPIKWKNGFAYSTEWLDRHNY